MKELLQGCRDFDRKSQREMVKHLSPYLYSICCRYSDDRNSTQDLLQEALILIFNNIESFSSNKEYAFKSWCKRIAINNALAKKRKNSIHLDDNVHDADILNSAVPSVHSQLNVEDILSLLNFLPENQKMVFNLAIIDGYSHKEISEILGIAESSSRTLLMRARQYLQESINNTEEVQ